MICLDQWTQSNPTILEIKQLTDIIALQMWWRILSLVNTKKDVYSVSDTRGSEEKIRVLPMGVEPVTLLFTSPDALPLSYRILMGAKATKLQ